MKGKSIYFIVGGAILILIFLFLRGGGKREEVKVSPDISSVQTQPQGPQADSGGVSGGKRHALNTTQFTEVKSESSQIKIPVADVDSGKAKFYTYAYQGKNVDFFIFKANDGTYRAAADACQVCFSQRKGYFQDGDVMQCRNCGNRYPSARVSLEKDGCNPGPISANVKADGSSLVLNTADVEGVGNYF